MACASGSASEYLPALRSALIRALSAARPFWAKLGVASDAVIASAKPATSVKRRRVMNPLAADFEPLWSSNHYGLGSQRWGAAFKLLRASPPSSALRQQGG